MQTSNLNIVQQSESASEAQWWPAPTCNQPVHSTVDVPGSKSASNRALVLSALSHGPSTISGLLDARDTQLMIAGLRALGPGIDTSAPESSGNVTARVTPAALTGPADIYVGLAGTVMRFLPPVAALATGPVSFDGDPHARVRPMQSMIDALRHVGVSVSAADGHLPFSLTSVGHVRGGTISIDASASSQFISGLLLSAARFENGLTITHVGPPVPSLPHIDMTIAMLREHGVEVDTDGSTWWSVRPGTIHSRDTVIEPDFSNAAPFMAAALITNGTVKVARWPNTSTQPGIAIRELLERMGARVVLDDSGLTVSGTGSIRGIDADLSAVGELAPTIAALAALASGPSRLTGIAHLRGHETDRLAALTRELNALGGDVVELPDGLQINPTALRGGRFHTYADHRMATAGALIGLHVPGIIVENIETTNKTIPDFPRRWNELLADHP